MSRLDPVRAAAARYDSTTIALHWATALLVAVLWILGETVDFWPRGPLRLDHRSLHIVLGVLLGGVILVRLAWRAAGGARLPVEGPPLMAGAARMVHWALYALVCLTIGLGVLNAFAHGDSLFGLANLPTWPAMGPTVGPAAGSALPRQIGEWHGLAANAVLILAGLHAAAALMHHYVLSDHTLRRMLPDRFVA